MVQLDSGGGGADGGLEGPDSQTEIEDDTDDAQERQLRPDAQSDPMEDQTEPVDRGSASQTTARPASGSGGAGATSGSVAGGGTGQQTAPGPEGGPQVSSGTPSGADRQQDGLTPDETTVATGGADDPGVTTGTPGDEGVPPSSFQSRDEPPTDAGDQADPIEVGAGEDPQQVVEREVEQQIEEQTGRDVTPGEEFEVVRQNGQFRVELSGPFTASLSREAAREAGRDLTEPTDAQFGSGEGPAVESGGIEVSTDYFERSPGEAVPHRGSIDVEAAEQLVQQREASRAQAEQTAPARLSGAAAASSAMGTQAQQQATEEEFGDIDWSFGTGDPEQDEVEAALGDASAAITEAGQDFASALFDEGGVASESLGQEVLEAAGRPDLGRQYEEGLREFGRGVAQAPFAIGNVPALGGAVLEGIEYSGYATQQDIPTTLVETSERGEEIGEAVYREATERPAELSGLVIGTLGASYGIMRAAANVGPRTGAVARYSIQPGEELAGTVGFRATRRVAGERRAQQLFPNREPLIFSEEFALRQARRLRERVEPRAAAARSRAVDVAFGEPETRVVREGPSEIEGFEESRLVTERPGPISQARAGVSRLEDAFTGRAFAGVPVARRAETQGQEVSVGAETETLLDELEGPLTRMERAQESRALERRRRVESRFDVERNPFRERARRSPLELETETEQETLTRLEQAQQPAVEEVTGIDVGTDVRSDIIAADIGRSDLAQEFELDQESGQELELLQELEFETEQDLVLDTELRFENELESELELEVEGETELEAEQFDLREERRDDDEFGILGPGTSRIEERDLRNPFTGR